MNLLPQHRRLLEASAISSEVAEERGYESVESKERLGQLGFGRAQRSVPALLMPVWDVTGALRTYLSRPDRPRIKGGRPLKYEIPTGSTMVLDVPRRAREHVGDPARPLLITEGARKADAAVSVGLCCVSLIGVWCWRGTNDKGGKTALPDFDAVALNGREVYIAFDSDVMVKREVDAALARLKPFLEQRGAHVFPIYLPPGEGGTKVGLDDYLAAGHDVADLFALARAELREIDAPDPHALPEYEFRGGELVCNRRGPGGVVSVVLANFEARIVADITEDDGVETRRLFELEATLNGRRSRFSIPAAQFKSMNWETEHLGAAAVVEPGMGTRDRARAGIQKLSGEVPELKVYAHTGWTRIGEA